MRPRGPVPFTVLRSIPNSRAVRRIDGDAWALLREPIGSVGSPMLRDDGEVEAAATTGAFAETIGTGGVAGLADAAVDSVEASSSVRRIEPWLTRSPITILSSWIVPLPDPGSSTFAFSHSLTPHRPSCP